MRLRQPNSVLRVTQPYALQSGQTMLQYIDHYVYHTTFTVMCIASNRGLDKISAGFRESVMSSVDGGVYDAINAMRSDLANKANQHRLLAEQLLTEVINLHNYHVLSILTDATTTCMRNTAYECAIDMQ
jgi:hypothetical protein